MTAPLPARKVPGAMPRWALTTGYVVRALFGLTTLIAASPSLLTVAGSTASAVLGALILAAGIVATIGSVAFLPVFRQFEMWGSIVLTACLIGYAAAPWQLLIGGDTQRLQLAALAIIAAVSPAGRAWHLVRTVGLNRA